MTGPICRWCGHYLTNLDDDHDEDDCKEERQRETNRRGWPRYAPQPTPHEPRCEERRPDERTTRRQNPWLGGFSRPLPRPVQPAARLRTGRLLRCRKLRLRWPPWELHPRHGRAWCTDSGFDAAMNALRGEEAT